MYFHSIFNILVVASSVLRFHMRLEVWEYGNFTISHEMFSRCNVFSTCNLDMSWVFVFAVNMFLGRGGVAVCFSLSHVGISMIFWERSTLGQGFTWKVRKKVPELEFEDV